MYSTTEGMARKKSQNLDVGDNRESCGEVPTQLCKRTWLVIIHTSSPTTPKKLYSKGLQSSSRRKPSGHMKHEHLASRRLVSLSNPSSISNPPTCPSHKSSSSHIHILCRLLLYTSPLPNLHATMHCSIIHQPLPSWAPFAGPTHPSAEKKRYWILVLTARFFPSPLFSIDLVPVTCEVSTMKRSWTVECVERWYQYVSHGWHKELNDDIRLWSMIFVLYILL